MEFFIFTIGFAVGCFSLLLLIKHKQKKAFSVMQNQKNHVHTVNFEDVEETDNDV